MDENAGWSAEELTNRPYLDFVRPEDRAGTLKEAELLASGRHETIRFENRYRHRDGSYRWLAWKVVVPPGSDQQVALESLHNTDPALAASPIIESAIKCLRQGIEDGRRTIRGIRPAVLDDSGLKEALDDLVGQFSNAGFQVTAVCAPAIGRLPEPIQAAVYRVVQQALNNARKHSGTDSMRIDVTKADGELQMEVRDSGCGFHLESARKRGFGLAGMMQRVQLLGGQCRIESAPDAGTRISLRLRLSQAATGRSLHEADDQPEPLSMGDHAGFAGRP